MASNGSGSPANTPDAVVADERRLAVHDLRRAHDVAAEHLADALVAEAHAEHRDAAGEVRDHVVGDAGVVRACPARAR